MLLQRCLIGYASDWLNEEKKSRAWFTDGSTRYAGITQKWRAVPFNMRVSPSTEHSGRKLDNSVCHEK